MVRPKQWIAIIVTVVIIIIIIICDIWFWQQNEKVEQSAKNEQAEQLKKQNKQIYQLNKQVEQLTQSIQQTTQTPVVQKSTPTPVVQQTNQPIDQTVSWRTYTNSKYGYEIKYPARGWQAQTSKDVVFYIGNDGASVSIYMVEGNVSISLDDWFKKQYNYYLNIPDGNPIYARPFDLNEAVDYNFNGISGKKTTAVSFDRGEKSIYFKNGNDVFEIRYTISNGNDIDFAQKLPALNQILSTFKFIN
ncbi:MAG: hypothetical protein V1768_01810 [Patescibacteria group bacterium]|nr:hypothetical protein [Patescibacteria group bacterium]MBU0879703.1 hypothetical protein [Patescibacteria group bacterium]MBU0880134.1 hypothetical protein [Patescibacteria group bacterium]MBU0897648.1 hypothetical protein [Patescibacteria group bacterium]MBU1063139.1 hypothetical protein [Patescibacteria group bacterium]